MIEFFKRIRRMGWKGKSVLAAHTIICVLVGIQVLHNIYFIETYFALFLCYCFWLNIRISKVLRFSHYLGELALDYGMRHINEIIFNKSLDPFDWFIGLEPGFERMLFSWKPLKLDAWFDEQTIKKIKS